MFTHSATAAIPGFPGAQYSFVNSGLPEMAQHNACSRPPDPTTSTLIGLSSAHHALEHERGPVMRSNKDLDRSGTV
jgi:hypothetical protein